MRMCFAFVCALLLAPAMGETPVQDLAKPPADAQHFTILSTAGKHGESARWASPTGMRMGRESLLLRGQVFETDSTAHVAADGMLDSVTIRGFTPNGDAAETLIIAGGKATWKSPVDGGSAAYAAPALYAAFGGPMDLNADFAEALIAAPDKTLPLLPSGRAHAELLTTAVVGAGASQRTVTAYAITGLNNTPTPIWVDDKGKFFGLIVGLAWLPAGYESALPILQN